MSNIIFDLAKNAQQVNERLSTIENDSDTTFGTTVETVNANLPLTITPSTTIGGVSYSGAGSLFTVEVRYLIDAGHLTQMTFKNGDTFLERSVYNNDDLSVGVITRVFHIPFNNENLVINNTDGNVIVRLIKHK